MSKRTNRRAHLRSDGAAENPEGIPMNNWDVERNVSEIEEGQFTMGSGESGGETRLQQMGAARYRMAA